MRAGTWSSSPSRIITITIIFFFKFGTAKICTIFFVNGKTHFLKVSFYVILRIDPFSFPNSVDSVPFYSEISIVLDSGKILYSMRLATNVRLPWSLLFSAWLLQQIEKRKNRNQEGKEQEKKRRKQKAIPRIVLLWYQLLWHGYSQWSTKENGEEGEGTEGDREGGELGKDANYID